MKILIYLAVWKRPEITEICFIGLRRIRKNFGFQACAVISEKWAEKLCREYGIDYVYHWNDPLGRKKNYGLTYALTRPWDYVVEIGSDDLLKNEFFDLYDWKRDLMCISDFAMMNTADGDCLRMNIQVTPFGVGRAISRRAVEKTVDRGLVHLWPDGLNRGLDNGSSQTLLKHGVMPKSYRSSEPLAMSLKSDCNIWKFKDFRAAGEPYDFAKAISGLSYDEVCAIKSLHVTV